MLGATGPFSSPTVHRIAPEIRSPRDPPRSRVSTKTASQNAATPGAVQLHATVCSFLPPAPPPPPPPPLWCVVVDQDVEKLREESPMLHLDLYNFDCPEAEGSRYVLTSPRSLEACARCAVKPVELLPRPLSELIKEAPGRSMRVAAGLYEVYEMDRQRKLQQCREERERIIREEKRRLFSPLLIGSLPSSPASRVAFKSGGASGSCGAAGVPRGGGPPAPPPAAGGAKTKKSHSLDSLQKRREGFSTKTSTDSGASSSYSGDSFRDKWPKEQPRTKTVATMTSLVGRSFSLGDLSHSPQTTKKVEQIVKEVKKKKGLKEVSERDRKIAALMIAKHQEASILNEQRYSAHLQWDIQKRQAEQRREQEEKEKQRALLQCQHMWETNLEKRRCKLSHEQEMAALLRQKQSSLEEEKWREQLEKQEKLKRERLEKAIHEDKKKKRHQEHNLKTQEESKKEATDREVQLLQEKLSLAAQKKLKREQLLQREKKLLNQAEKRKHEAILKELTKQEAEEKATLRASLEGSWSKAQGNYEQLIEKRNQELRERARREEMQSQRARLAAERKDREQKEHLKALAEASERKLQHATQVAEEVVQQKARKVVQTRMEKEKVQRVNKKKVEQCEDIRRREILQSIERKLERSEQICKEKKSVLENARSVARASFHVREKVREEMNMRTFDKMAFEAELQAGLVKK
ncbi:coiled-coil domain-containing protein 177 [Varanus komodoensis]|uniref:coiled-coil domain-containing protein 177 n=1 Tax=Varanus komodoensis TaxID=61221 RepID=UPI001CF7B8C6|nr:coiled-coil domain-containing protein 177 [Varanus komodoensis]